MTAPAARPSLRVLLVDDSELVRAGLRTLLGLESSLAVVGEAATAAAAIAASRRLAPDVVLLDIRLPDESGIQACRRILSTCPETRVLFLTSVIDDATVDDAIRAGAHGYLLKEIDGRGLVQAIRDVAAGLAILDPAITARVLHLVKSASAAGRPDFAALSAQEKRVLALIADGCTNKEVATRLGLSEKTVRNYLGTVFEKLHVSRRTEAAVIYARSREAGAPSP
ncbi:MAG: response regulator transcription factor [Verrucomicrobia bacterium]|nr:response regulator transcription factor [Verrucomicrobiota bacterium]